MYFKVHGFFLHEDPPPAFNAMRSVKLNESIGQNVTKRRHEEIDHVPKRHPEILVSSNPEMKERVDGALPLLHLVSLVPAAEEVHTARQETGLKDANEHSAHHYDAPVVGKAHAQHDGAPAQHQAVEK